MNNNQADGFDDLLVLMEYTMDDLFTMFKKWIVSIGGGDEDKGRVVFRSIVDYLSDEYKTTAKKDISIHYLMRLLVVLRDRFPDNVSKADVMRWDSKHNVIPNLSLLDDVLKSKKYLRLALEYSPYMKEEEEDVYDYVEPLSEDEIKKILEKLDRFHQIKTEKDFIDILNIIEKCHEALEIWEEGSKLSGEETSTAIIYTVKNYYHAVTLGKGSKWCITQNHHYTNYASQCNLYVIIPKEGKKYSTTKAGDVTEKYALAINKDLFNLERLDETIKELREEYN
ncbi:MAG: hypothetical protein N3A54_00775, partial [Patescibacteria group bacterium]|nr:hypothetical protein [Patescibacteria group bacterium]